MDGPTVAWRLWCVCAWIQGSVLDPPPQLHPDPEHCTRGGTYYAAGFRSPEGDGAVLMAGPRKAWTPTAAEPASRRAARRRSRLGCCCRERAMCKIDLEIGVDLSVGWKGAREPGVRRCC